MSQIIPQITSHASLPASAPLSSLHLSPSSPAPARVLASSLDHKLYVLPYSLFVDNSSAEEGAGGSGSGGKNVQSWTAHDGPVWSAKWADPCWGVLILSGGGDGCVNVWEEDADGKWTRKCSLDEARAPIREVEWGPYWGQNEGLRVASISTDSHFRMYISLDATFTDWTLSVDIDLNLMFSSPSPSLNGADFMTASIATLTSNAWALAWIKDGWWGDRVAVSFGSESIVRLIYLPSAPSRPPLPFLQLEPSAPNVSPIGSISWSPSCGRSYQLIATGHRDGSMRIWKLFHPSSEGEEGEWSAEVVGEFGWEEMGGKGVHGTRVEWNTTGTILSCSCADGAIRIFKPTYVGDWKCVNVVNGDWGDDE
ncbi:WD40 repeat-like protein [Atractiella rhizophila]|nr:WD40 repeat-like protein [Atractiella rhizophila]